jgi:hypothetical protein
VPIALLAPLTVKGSAGQTVTAETKSSSTRFKATAQLEKALEAGTIEIAFWAPAGTRRYAGETRLRPVRHRSPPIPRPMAFSLSPISARPRAGFATER